ncbi:hypothetical protein [Nannocystis sp.]|uniref:hypothetical protein n=1 Tax=Nannocystis sp. TaxID=1962667 RepID=UPI0024207630|nr:hypothetical protein [Nannocystis sp.]MBK7828281.1 hypothetical protein [Nannocystis sp.]MBK9757403.1 hypothetical protein [Nannocystis sp.]
MRNPRGTHLAGLSALLLLAACPEKDDGSTSDPTDTAATTGATGDTTEPTTADTVDTDAVDTDAVDTDTTATTDTDATGGPVFPPVDCGDVTCAENQLCVNPGGVCDYNMDPPDWVPQPSACQDVPPACAQMQDADARAQCFGETLCPDFEFGGPSNLEGSQLNCPDQGADCF